ncbi:MAG: acetyl-CoA carboxylase biotin carboxylase subunit [Deltaproteobacteria bacterium]|nr:MAG: acetyl-CoA carboxylase biotin carboxylase subunit [Deltaproteobacteria bacterium]
MFEKILIANRGEIAIRIIQSCKRMDIRTVAVYSEADSRSLHVLEADEAVLLGGAKSEESYLVKEKIIDAALKHNCQAIHPGYGFLSENPEFAEMVSLAGLVFIGPPASAIATLGDKIASKAMAIRTGLPIVPGHTGVLSDIEEILAIAEQIGYPILLKPVAGGGGKGMRIVTKKEELGYALEACKGETRKAFGDDKIFVERYIAHPRHVEIQIIADYYGNIIHLGERECSIQRRYQKIIEETPSMAVDDSLRQKMGKMACDLAREAGYSSVGTVEFILDTEQNFYFLEMNTRLQVEHPVTEMITSLDLVELQLLIAAGEPIPIRQEEVSMKGWAIEARICAEDPSRGFMPTTGMVTRYFAPRGKHIRVDSGIKAGSLVNIYYDPMLAKVAAWGETREDSRKLLVSALNGYHIEGIITNVHFTNAILNHPAFIRGELHTDFIEEHFEDGQMKIAPPQERLHYMALAVTLVYHNRQNLVRDSLKPMVAQVGGIPDSKTLNHYMVRGENDIFELRLEGVQTSRTWTIWVNKNQYQVITPEFAFYQRRLKLKINDESHRFHLQYHGNFIWAAYCGITRTFEIYSPREWKLAKYMPRSKKMVLDNILRSPMPGLVVDIKVKKGERVYRGQELIIIEAMKMESGVASPCDGEVQDVMACIGQAVETGDTLLTFRL